MVTMAVTIKSEAKTAMKSFFLVLDVATWVPEGDIFATTGCLKIVKSEVKWLE